MDREDIMSTQGTFLPAAKVRERYGVSDMSLWRWLRDSDLAFPKPIYIRGRRFWRLADLETWEAARQKAARPGTVA
jgi:predicted DNA-binding transcriptional regulator AlpA